INSAPGGDAADIINALDQLPDAASLADALDQLSPELFTLGTTLTGLNTGGFNAGMTGRLDSLRTASTNRTTEAGPALAAAPAADRPAGQGWSPWAKAFYTTAEQDTTDGFVGYSYDAMGASVGIDKGVADNLVLGVTVGMAASDSETEDKLGQLDVDTLSMGVYGSWTSGKLYVDGTLLAGMSSFDSRRLIPLLGSVATGDHDGFDYAASVGGGYKVAMAGWNLIPTAGVQYAYHEEEGFVETGVGGLAVEKADTDSLQGKLGLRINRLFQVGDSLGLMPEVSAQWGHEFGDTEQEALAWFAGTNTGTFTVKGLDADRESFLMGLGLTAFVSDNIALSASYEGMMKDELEAHTVLAGLRYMF
ncbi:MAG: autotransporter outer membrane beta-barrel domain-containing protein, partial [Thermodesulfobacteriota bacterium]